MKQQYILSFEQGEHLKELQTKIMSDCDLAKDAFDRNLEVGLYLRRIEGHAKEMQDILGAE